VRTLESDIDRGIRGLTSEQAERRASEYGTNEIRREMGPSAWSIFASQLKSALIWVLIGAAILAAVLGEVLEAVAIGVIVVANAVVGFVQEFRAERALEALRSLTAPRARVLRNGHSVMVPALAIVPGDVLVVEAGDLVAADARVLEAHGLTTNEAPLTGESVPVEKRAATNAAEAEPREDSRWSVFMGTSVVGGSGLAEVTATGMATELGKIARLLAEVRSEPTPLQRQLDRVGRTLLVVCLAVVVLVALAGLLRGAGWLEVVLFATSLAVGAVPEGLTAITTLALALGVQRLAARHVLVRRLPSVETLGCTTTICTDKTGTLTTGIMSVREIWAVDPHRLLDAAAACSSAELDESGRGGMGDPTEVALLVAAAERGIHRETIERERPPAEVRPFDPERRSMSIRRADGVLYVKGAIDALAPSCAGDTSTAREVADELASRGMRVLAVAVGRGADEQGLELVGLVGLADPPRTEAIEAVAAARKAGIRTIMITGDHPATARAIARELGIVRPGDVEAELVHARATPEDKLRIVRDWKARGEIVAMTGDGVNDAPALREAHIGIAMGKSGTEVARQASSMVLVDDSFASIVEAIREGRGIFANIRKTLVYLLAGNTAEILIVLAASLAGLPLPLTALQILWINLVTETMPALALVTDPTEGDVLARPPRRPDEPILGRAQWLRILCTGGLQAGVALGAFAWALHTRDVLTARNFAFSVLVFGDVLRSLAARSDTRVFWSVGVLTNVRLVAVVALTVLLQLGLHHIPWSQRIFEIGAVSLSDCALMLLFATIPVTVLELGKLVRPMLARRWAAKSKAGHEERT
jgi:Ca2+-transporting ATPase